MSEDGAERLQTVIDAEAGLYARMRDLLEEEREVLFSLDAVRLEAVTRRKAELIDEGRVLESGRKAVVAQLAAELALPVEGLRLSVLCERMGPGHGALRRAHNQLVVLLSVVRELMKANRSVAGQSLSEVRSTLDVLGGVLPEGAAYGPDGHRPAPKGRLLRQSA